jgi:anaerobic magnesium-protoporphyrin IX monomethyl ester cyclase
MRILFLEFDTEHDWAVASLGPSFLAAYLRQHNHEARFLRIPVDRAISDIAEDVRRTEPDHPRPTRRGPRLASNGSTQPSGR